MKSLSIILQLNEIHPLFISVEEEQSTYILSLKNKTWTCVTCNKSQNGDASEGNKNGHLKPHEKTYNMIIAGLEDEDGDVDSSKAS